MGQEFYTSDTFFGRGAADDGEIIRAWNEKVRLEDEVHLVGDFCVDQDPDFQIAVLGQLNGRVNLIRSDSDRIRRGGDGARRVNEHLGYVHHQIVLRRQRVVLSHYPFEQWPGMHNGFLHLHGGVEGELQHIPGRVCVSIQLHGQPLTLDEIRFMEGLL